MLQVRFLEGLAKKYNILTAELRQTIAGLLARLHCTYLQYSIHRPMHMSISY